MKKDSLRNWAIKVFIRDISLKRGTIIYLFFSILSITLVAEAFLFKYVLLTGGLSVVGIEIYVFLITLAISFLISGPLVDKIKHRTKFFNITLLICLLGLIISNIPLTLFYYIGLFAILLTIPQLILLWFTILVHETNILNRGRLTAYLMISGFSLGYISVIFIIYEFLYPILSILELCVFLIVVWYSREYSYIETDERLKSDKKFLNIIVEKHFFRYSSSLTALSFIFGYLLAGYGFDIDFLIFGLASFTYLIAAGCCLDNIGRKTSIVLGILVLSFFLVSFGSFIESSYIFGLPRKVFLSIHYGFSILPLLLAKLTISGDFSTERGNLKFRGRINSLFLSLLFFGAILGFVFSIWINDIYDRFPIFENFLPNFPNLLNGFILVILLVWMMGMKEFLVSKEKKWADSLKNIFVFNKHGICLYNYSFEKKELIKEGTDEAGFDEDLVSGALTGVITIISEITNTKRELRQIQKDEATLLFTYGKYHIVALIVSMELPVLFKKLDAFSRAFENKFSKELKGFKGNVACFEPASFLLTKYFSKKYSEFSEK